MTLFRILKSAGSNASWEKNFFRRNLTLPLDEKGNSHVSFTKYNVELSIGENEVTDVMSALLNYQPEKKWTRDSTSKRGDLIWAYHEEAPPSRVSFYAKSLGPLLKNFIAYEVGLCMHDDLTYQSQYLKNNIEFKFIEINSDVYDMDSAKEAAHKEGANILILNIHVVLEANASSGGPAKLSALLKSFCEACQTTQAQELFYSTANNFKRLGYKMMGRSEANYDFYLENKKFFAPEPVLVVKPLTSQGLINAAISRLSSSFYSSLSIFSSASESSSSSSSSSRSYSYSSDED